MCTLNIVIAIIATVQELQEEVTLHMDTSSTKYNVKIEQSCHDEFDQDCHQEFDTVVDTTYVEECRDIITQHCPETHQQVHHSSAVVGHDSEVVSHGQSGYGKREVTAEAEPGYGHNQHNHFLCFSRPHKQCVTRSLSRTSF